MHTDVGGESVVEGRLVLMMVVRGALLGMVVLVWGALSVPPFSLAATDLRVS
jgi:hypothetical protein